MLETVYERKFPLSFVLPGLVLLIKKMLRNTFVRYCSVSDENCKNVATMYLLKTLSLTCIMWKVMKHLVLTIMWKHLNRNSIIRPHQHGFRSGLFCATQLVEAVHD